MQVTSGGGQQKPASSKQKFWLFKLTRRPFDGDTKIGVGEASEIMDLCFKIRKVGPNNAPLQDMRRLETLMQKFYPDWQLQELNLEYIPSGATKKKKPPVEPEPAPEPPQPSSADSFPYGTGDQHQENADDDQPPPVEEWLPDDSPYADLPASAQEKIKEIERILKERGQQQAETTPESDEKPPEDVVEPPPIPEVSYPGLPAEFVVPKDFDYWVKLAEHGINFMLVGPSGCGKTYPAQMIAKALNMESFVCSFSGGVRYSQAFGSTKIENGETRFEPSELLKQIQKPVLVILDEAMSADADITIGLNSVTEPNQRFINTPAGRIDVHPDCRFIATANNKGRSQSRAYIGAQVQDGSILDRFGVKFDVDYDDNVEMQVCLQYVSQTNATKICNKIKKLREKLRQSEIHFDPSTRRLIMCCQQVKLLKVDVNKAFETTFLTSLSHAERQTIGM